MMPSYLKQMWKKASDHDEMKAEKKKAELEAAKPKTKRAAASDLGLCVFLFYRKFQKLQLKIYVENYEWYNSLTYWSGVFSW